jgi:hypothetical protein
MANRPKKEANRKKAKRIAEHRNQEIASSRRSRIREILKALGLWHHLEHTTIAEKLLTGYWPGVSIGLSNAVQSDRDSSAILKSVENVVENATISLPPLGEEFPIKDVFSFLLPTIDVLHTAVSKDAGLSNVLQEAKRQTEHMALVRVVPIAVHELQWRLNDALAEFCRIDADIYFLTLNYGWNDKKKWSARFEVQSEKPRVRMVKTDTGERDAFCCGAPNGTDAVDWIEWPRSLLGLDDGGLPLPVYVQGHALDNLYKKEARALFSKNWEWLVHDYLWQSLKQHKIANTPRMRQKGKFLVEYWLNAHKLGYLVGRVVNDIVLIETFLFLTMNETPEGDKLYSRRGLARLDKEHLHLDKLQTFLWTDIQFDAELVAILEECGCGDLFRIWINPPLDEHIRGRAVEMRRYLNLNQ